MKFRIWDTDIKEFKYYDLFDLETLHVHYSEYLLLGAEGRNESDNWEEIPYTSSFCGEINLCSGFKDINNKELYDKDYVLCNYNLRQIKYEKGCFWCVFPLKKGLGIPLSDVYEKCKIIGNTYQHIIDKDVLKSFNLNKNELYKI